MASPQVASSLEAGKMVSCLAKAWTEDEVAVLQNSAMGASFSGAIDVDGDPAEHAVTL